MSGFPGARLLSTIGVAAAALAAMAPAVAFDVGFPATDPARDLQTATREVVIGPAPVGFAPLMPPGSGLTVTAVQFDGDFTRDAVTTALAFHANLTVDGQTLEPGIFLGCGSVDDFQPPDRSTSMSYEFPSNRGDVLAETLTDGGQSEDAQRLRIEFTPLAGTQSLHLRFVFGTEEFPNWIGTQFNDAFGIFLFHEGETSTMGGQFYNAPPTFRELADQGLWYTLTADQIIFLKNHQIAFDPQKSPITVNGWFFSNGNVVTPPTNGLESNGSTQILETVAPLVPGEHYVLYIVIADTADQDYDSGVFIASLTGASSSVSEAGTTITTSTSGGSTGVTTGGTTGASTGGHATSGGATGIGGHATTSGGSSGATSPPATGGTGGTTGASSTTAGAGGGCSIAIPVEGAGSLAQLLALALCALVLRRATH